MSVEVFTGILDMGVLWAPADKIEEQVIRRPSASWLTMLPQSRLSGHLTTDHMWARRTGLSEWDQLLLQKPSPRYKTVSPEHAG